MDGALKALVNRSVNFMMDKYGNIIEFKGIEETQAAIREDLTGTQLEAQADQFVASFGEEVLRSNLEGNLSIYAGDNSKEWNRNFSTVLNQFPAQLDVKLWYDTNESILADAKVVIKGEIEQMGMAMTTDLAGTQNSIFDLSANGMPTKVQTKIDTEGNMMAQGMEIPMKMTNMTTVTFTKK